MLEQILSLALPFLPILIGIIVVLFLLVSTIKVASGNEVLVVTGVGATKKVTKKSKIMRDGVEVDEPLTIYLPKIVVAGAAFVIPFIQQCKRFDICVKKAKKDNDTMKTKTGVEIVIDWSISYAPNAESTETLQPCIRQFLDKDDEETEDIVMSSVAGGMRAVISTMTPNEVMVGKETLDEAVQKNIAAQMAELGYKVQIYIQEVRDAKDSTYYRDLAAQDREQTRQNAAQITADADKAIRERKAQAEQTARQAELDSEVAISERQRDAAVKQAKFKAETDQAEADAAIAGQLRTEERNRELTEKQGAVEVMKQQQAEQAAQAEQAVEKTRAETEKARNIIAAQATAEQDKIKAEANAAIAETKAEGEAKAARAKAQGEADAKRTQAEGEAAAVKVNAEAEAERIRATGQAEADATRAKGEAEAAAIEAKGKAEAEAALALSEAQAANDRVNFEVAKLEIQKEVQIKVATSIAEVMASVGQNAKFVDFGGGGGAPGTGSDLLTRVMGNIPTLFAKANLQSEALNEQELPDIISQLTKSVLGPLGEALHGSQTPELPAGDKDSDEPTEGGDPSVRGNQSSGDIAPETDAKDDSAK